MNTFKWQTHVTVFDERRDIIIPGTQKETVDFCTRQFLEIGNEAIQNRDAFYVALSGGTTPNAIFKELSDSKNIKKLDWTKVVCFWSDERSVPPDSPDSNYGMAMKAGLSKLPIPEENIIRMEGEEDIEAGGKKYDHLIRERVPNQVFDLVMLGMGEDGHTASLFPQTHALHSKDRLAVANHVPQKNTWRMTLTYDCIHRARVICIYVLGKNKSEMAAKALLSPFDPDVLPVQKIGTPKHKALWILDKEAASRLMETFNK